MDEDVIATKSVEGKVVQPRGASWTGAWLTQYVENTESNISKCLGPYKRQPDENTAYFWALV